MAATRSSDITQRRRGERRGAEAARPPAVDLVILDGKEHPLSGETKRLVAELLDAVSSNHAVEVRVLEDTLSTQEAADLLSVSRPTLVKMLDDGLIEFDQPAGVHRRIPRIAVEEFLAQRQEWRRNGLRRIAETYSPEVDKATGFVETR